MKQKVFAALVAFALAMVVHGYLTMHYYPLVFGYASGPSLCNINAKLDCDAVTASAYSAVFGIPIAAFGFAFNALLFTLVLLTWLGLRGGSDRSWRDPLWLALGSVGVSVVMGTISTVFIGSFCLFCIAAYVLSFIGFFALWWALPDSPWRHFGADILSWFSDRRSMLAWLAAVPVGAGFIHLGMKQSNSADKLEAMSKLAVSDWETAPVVQWTATPSLIKGASAESAIMVVTEFADFLCGHCKTAAPGLAAFAKAHPDVRMVFYSFPLDSTCNPKMQRGDGASCRLAKAVFCAERQTLGWAMHDRVFELQSSLFGKPVPDLDKTLRTELEKLNGDWAQLETCMNDEQTHTVIQAQAELGATVGVRGTPAVYVNGKAMDLAGLVLSLNLARQRILKAR